MGGSIVYKGTLSSGVEIAVSSTAVSSLKDWSNNAEKEYKNKVAIYIIISHIAFLALPLPIIRLNLLIDRYIVTSES